MRRKTLALHVNGSIRRVGVLPYDSLNRVLREYLGLTGTKRSCDTGGCGACTVIVDGRAIYSCLYPALKARRKKVLTIEGLSPDKTLHPIQRAFVEKDAVQCGFCIPGMIMSAWALHRDESGPSEETVRRAMAGNLCRCTGYTKIVEAVMIASQSSL